MKAEQKRMVMAMVLSALVLIAWEKFFAPKKISPVNPVNQASQSRTIQDHRNTSKSSNLAKHSTVPSTALLGKQISKNLQSLTLDNSKQTITLQNDFNISNFKTFESKKTFNEILGNGKLGLNIDDNGTLRQVIFDDFKKEGQKIVAHSSIYKITATFILTENRVNYTIRSKNKYKYNFTLLTDKKTLPNKQIRQFIVYNNKKAKRYSIDDDDKGDSLVKWFGVDFNYHLFVNVFNQPYTSLYTVKDNLISNTIVSETNKISGYYTFLFKKYDLLKTFGAKGDNLQMSVDFGFFGIVAVPMLKVLQFFYKYLGNYGLAIIFLTIFLRLITFPLQFKSFKSMKKMQVVQPELAKIKEKYKDDPKKVQQETMALFKNAGANPLGGCLPMVLQMPIFFAFYKVLYSAVELVDAPFYFWIHDLSIKDPYYVLPVLMTITMFVQNRLNPSASADPTQKKMMMFMPLIFGFIMKDLPSGLNLYMTISMALGSAQQLMVYKFTD